MAYRKVRVDHMLRGTLLAMVEKLFPEGAPRLDEYCAETSVSASTFRRAAQWLLGLLPALLRRRRPGPQSNEEDAEAARREALGKLEDLKLWLRGQRKETATNTCYGPEAKQKIASLAEEIVEAGALGFAEIARVLGMHERQLYRIRQDVREAGGDAPGGKSRRPHKSGTLSEEIQRVIRDIEASADSRRPYSGADVKRILENNYKEQLLEHHGSETISETTVRKYMQGRGSEEREAEGDELQPEHPRGKYHYPEPFQQVAIDTSHFKLFGRTFYLITVLELGGRLNLVTRVFLRESTEAVVRVTEEYLGRYPQVEAAVIDRGSPYLNAEVERVLREHGKLRIVCPPETPTAKAACERHFATLKPVLRSAVEKVLGQDPGWEPEQLSRALELAVVVFQQLYHRIPQDGIDGKSPGERIQDCDPLRACASSLELFRRALESEPAAEFARHLHRRFQLPGREQETVRRLKQFGTRALRRVEQEVAAFMGPPLPEWMYDPVGYLAARAREVWEREREEFLRERYLEEQRRRAASRRAAEAEAIKEERQHPERSVDTWIATLVKVVRSGFKAGQPMVKRFLRDGLAALARQLGSAFSAEVRRLKEKVATLADDSAVEETVRRILEELTEDLASGQARMEA